MCTWHVVLLLETGQMALVLHIGSRVHRIGAGGGLACYILSTHALPLGSTVTERPACAGRSDAQLLGYTGDLVPILRPCIGRWLDGKSSSPNRFRHWRWTLFSWWPFAGPAWYHMIMSPFSAPPLPSSSSDSSRSCIGYVRMAAMPPRLPSLWPLSWSLLSTLASPPSSLTLSTMAT